MQSGARDVRCGPNRLVARRKDPAPAGLGFRSPAAAISKRTRSRRWYGLCLNGVFEHTEVEQVHAARAATESRRGLAGCRRSRRGLSAFVNATYVRRRWPCGTHIGVFKPF